MLEHHEDVCKLALRLMPATWGTNRHTRPHKDVPEPLKRIGRWPCPVEMAALASELAAELQAAQHNNYGILSTTPYVPRSRVTRARADEYHGTFESMLMERNRLSPYTSFPLNPFCLATLTLSCCSICLHPPWQALATRPIASIPAQRLGGADVVSPQTQNKQNWMPNGVKE